MFLFDLSQRISYDTLSMGELNEYVEASIMKPVREYTMRRSVVINGFLTSDGDEAMNDTFMTYEMERVRSVSIVVSQWGVQVAARLDRDVAVQWTVTVTLFESEAAELAAVR